MKGCATSAFTTPWLRGKRSDQPGLVSEVWLCDRESAPWRSTGCSTLADLPLDGNYICSGGDEWVDFIRNFDVKYRIGRESADEILAKKEDAAT